MGRKSWTGWVMIGTGISDTPSAVSWGPEPDRCARAGRRRSAAAQALFRAADFLILVSVPPSGTRNRRSAQGMGPARAGKHGTADALGLFREHETRVQGTRL